MIQSEQSSFSTCTVSCQQVQRGLRRFFLREESELPIPATQELGGSCHQEGRGARDRYVTTSLRPRVVLSQYNEFGIRDILPKRKEESFCRIMYLGVNSSLVQGTPSSPRTCGDRWAVHTLYDVNLVRTSYTGTRRFGRRFRLLHLTTSVSDFAFC